MKTITIRRRHTDAVLFTYDVEDDDAKPIRTALLAAVRAGREPEKLRAEREDLIALQSDNDEWNALTEDAQNASRALLAIVDQELVSPRPRADLAGADLAGANLAGADLAGADLADANLARANLAGADLARADLAGADLADADLAGADLAGADLAGADLAGANLAGADLAGADLAGADLADAIGLPSSAAAAASPTEPREPYKRATTPEEITERSARRAERYRLDHPDVPVIPQLDRKILEAITVGKGVLNMSDWHHGDACGTTHCRAGWAIFLAGSKGAELEREHGPERAGAMIYRASTGRVPHFYAENANALRDIEARAAEQAATSTESPAP